MKALKEYILLTLLPRGLLELTDDIKFYISRLPHVGESLPRMWVKVRKELEKNQHLNFITLEKCLDICRENGIIALKDKLQLIEYLHDLGVCLHFKMDPLLNKTVILNTKWATKAVYKVLDNQTVAKNKGRFNKADLISIWSEEKYIHMHDELLQLMLKFRKQPINPIFPRD